MECNKEEAIRAKEIAEKKMQNKDFVGARKVALKAQMLFSDLDNISQILTVCEVHCCAGVRVNAEMDWYGILQVDQTADESSIKKQYRKLALLLHPDKNKFAGAEAAFKLIGEAHMTLSDRVKRSVYDMKRRANIVKVMPRPAQQPNMTSFARKQPGAQNNFTSTATFHNGNINQQQSSRSQTFWTICPSCCMKFQYYRNLLNKSIRCHRCMANYIASELNEQAVPRPWESSAHDPNHSQNSKKEVPVQASSFGNSSRPGFQGNVTGGSSSGVNMVHTDVGSTSKQKEDGFASGTGNEVKPEKVDTGKAGKEEHLGKPSSVSARRKKGQKRIIDSSDSDSSTDSGDLDIEDGVHSEEQNAGSSSGRYPRRSCRMKQNVTYNERGIEDDDDFVSLPKRLKKTGSAHAADHGKTFPGATGGIPNNCNDDQRKDTSGESLPNGGGSVKKCKVEVKEEIFKARTRSSADPVVDSESKALPSAKSFSSPDSEFYDFEQERDPRKFAADQIWAVYDDLDAMPRYYARIREVLSPFRLRFSWLEHEPLTDVEKVWTHEELPVACGNYRLGKQALATGLQMFSHFICWEKGTRRNTYSIYPRKGEVWALFKGWDSGWSAGANSRRLYEYEVVEVLSDLSDGSDFQVVRLVKVQGFVSLFVRSAIVGNIRILPAEVLQFSHRVPSYRMSGSEREGVPEGSFELDTASLPGNFGEAFPSVSLDSASVKAQKLNPNNTRKDVKTNEENNMNNTRSKGLSPRGVNGVSHNANSDVAAEHPVSPVMSSDSTSSECLENEFHDFQEDRTIEKFQPGQIWALYSDIDGYPKFYAKIKKVDVENVKVRVSWVELCPQGEDEKEWTNNELPATCGRFQVDNRTTIFDHANFSHLVQAEPTGEKGEYDIYPRRGEVWALYKDWNMGLTCSGLGKCEHDVVEILEVGGSVVKVLFLTKVADYNAVFMPEIKGGVKRVMEISLNENLRFSHQIPAFRLTGEVGGSLQGYWELDSESLPNTQFM